MYIHTVATPHEIGRPGRRHFASLSLSAAVRAIGLFRVDEVSERLLSARIGVSLGRSR